MTEERPLRRLRPVGSRSGASREPYYNKSWALVIGINDYGDRHPPLANARNDAEAVAKTLQETYHFDDVFALYDKEATYSSILEWLKDDLPTRTEPHDRLVFFFAGHGTTREGAAGYKRGYLIPQDAEPGKYSSFIDMSELRDACSWIRAKHILIVLDCCFSGVAAVTSRATPPATPGKLNDVYLQRITERSAWQVLTAGASDELVADSGLRPGHSAFTRALLSGLEGQADQNNDGLITATELANYVKPEVIRESASGGAKGQTPFFNYLVGSGQGDFVFQLTERPHLAAVPEANLFSSAETLSAEVLRRAWDDWHEKGYLAHEQAGDDHAAAGEFLIGPARLREIRERRQGLEIKAEWFCLLLRSAVFHRCDTAYWAQELAKDEGAQQLLMQIHHGLDGGAPDEAESATSLGAAALGIDSRDVGEQALARAAVGRHPGSVRHTAALAMGAAWQVALDPARSSGAGMTEEEVRQTLAALTVAAASGRARRRVQALAQIKAAGLRLPPIPGRLQFQVDLWRMGIRLAEARWRLVSQAIGAGLGGGFGLLYPTALVYTLAAGYSSLPEIASGLLIGWVVGMGFAAGRWLLDTLAGGRVWRVVGASLGFCLGLVALWPFTPHLSGWQLATGLLAGAAVALGGELLALRRDGDRERAPVTWWAGLGGGLGGASIFAVTALSVLRLPFVLGSEFFASIVDPPWVAALSLVVAAITGAMVGFGLTGGSALGEEIYRRLSVRYAPPD